MADQLSLLRFLRYDEECDRSERVVLPRRNPLEEYDETKFRQRFRLSKFTATKLMDEVHCRTRYIVWTNNTIERGRFCDYKRLQIKVRQARRVKRP